MVERNSHGMFANLVVFPGGTSEVEDGDLRHTALRELREETGVDVDDVDRLTLVSRWVTPSVAPERFDTIFYLLELASSVEAVVDGREVVGHAWVTPEEALGLARTGTWAMILPTLSHLRWLNRRSSISEALFSARGADGQTLVEPRYLDDGTWLPIHRPPES